MILQEIFQSTVLILFFISAAILIFLILIQSGKGGGMGMLGGGGSGSAFGSSSVDIVEKVTWWGATAFFVLAVLAAIAFADTGPSLPVKENGVESSTMPGSSLPDDAAGKDTGTPVQSQK